MTTWLFVVIFVAIVSAIAHTVTSRFVIACIISTILPVAPILVMAWHHVEHWYTEPLQLVGIGLSTSVVTGLAVVLIKRLIRRDGSVQ